MISIYLQLSTKLISKIMSFVSILMLFRGHNHPGGGFIGGLIAASSISLIIISTKINLSKIEKYAQIFLSLGIFFLIITFLFPSILGNEPLNSMWLSLYNNFKIGSPYLFDVGIYLIVSSAIIWIISEMEEIE